MTWGICFHDFHVISLDNGLMNLLQHNRPGIKYFAQGLNKMALNFNHYNHTFHPKMHWCLRNSRFSKCIVPQNGGRGIVVLTSMNNYHHRQRESLGKNVCMIKMNKPSSKGLYYILWCSWGCYLTIIILLHCFKWFLSDCVTNGDLLIGTQTSQAHLNLKYQLISPNTELWFKQNGKLLLGNRLCPSAVWTPDPLQRLQDTWEKQRKIYMYFIISS